MDSLSILDPDALDRIDRFGGETMLAQLLAIFERDTPGRIEAARAALRDGELTVLADTAHSLKSSAGNLGASALFSVARQLEADARAGRTDPLPQHLLSLEACYREAVAALKLELERRV